MSNNMKLQDTGSHLARFVMTSWIAITLVGSSLAQVQQPKPASSALSPGTPPEGIVLPDAPDIAAMKKKADGIVIPKLVFKEASIRDCLAFLVKKSRELDPEKVGVSLMLKLDFDSPATAKAITLDAQDVPLMKAIEQVAEQAGFGVQVDADSIIVMPLSELSRLVNKEYELPLDMLTAAGAGSGPSKSMDEFLDNLWSTENVMFPEGTVAIFEPPRRLLVRNTPANHQVIAALIEKFQTKKQTQLSAPLIAVVTKLKTIVLPKLQFEEMEFRKCAALLEEKSRELDPEKKGIKIALRCRKEALTIPLTIHLEEVPLREALKYITGLAGLAFRLNEEGVIIVDAPE
jgi:hypothetical protein